ncbi:hypothetical protein BC941DRAFT_419477 [Chlamydoabsidia padenii]|nr:hypothetical protein BC941DRAFT_419477 [Chlamydoabsidia padenii]
MTKTAKKQQGFLTIELLPEFGLSLNGEPVYGPGSVFQGIVRLSLPPQHNAQRLRIVFHATETVQLHSTMTSVIRGRHHQLFGTQRILWEKPTNTNNQPTVPSNQYMFTIQMPMIQHPPSMDYGRLRYRCKYRLTAMLDSSSSTVISSTLHPLFTAHQTVHYRPWITTRTLKVPLIRHSRWLVVKMPSTDYVTGDTCQLDITLSPSALAYCVRSSLVGMQIVMELVQIATLPCQLEDERIPPSETVVCRSKPTVIHAPPPSLLLLDQQSSGYQRRTSISSSAPSLVQACLYTSTRLSLSIPNDIPPTYGFGRVITIHYELALKVLGKKRNKQLWASAFTSSGGDEIRIPLVIGTLGHGIRIPDDMKTYTNFSGVFGDTRTPALPSSSSSSPSHLLSRVNTSTSVNSISTFSMAPRRPPPPPPSRQDTVNDEPSQQDHQDNAVPVPKFLQTVEYENTLPSYHPSTLPPYTPSIPNQCIAV